MRIAPNTAVALSMVLHELAANAARHGALSTPTGRVMLAWTIEPGKSGATMILNWRESGGPPVVEPAKRGFGLRLVERSIVQELSGMADIAFEPSGVHCILSFPIGAEDAATRLQPATSKRAPENASIGA
jgi:two-component sensor histidine kinase